MGHLNINRTNSSHEALYGAHECLAWYFSGCPEVSSVFMNQGSLKVNAETSIAVLVKDAGMDCGTLAALSNRYALEAQACGLGPVNVEVLNMSSSAQQYRILREWTLVFERNRSFRTWFYEQAACDCQATALAA